MGHKLPPDSIMVSVCAHACGAAAQSVMVEQSQVNQEVISEDASLQGVFLCGGSDSLERPSRDWRRLCTVASYLQCMSGQQRLLPQ